MNIGIGRGCVTVCSLHVGLGIGRGCVISACGGLYIVCHNVLSACWSVKIGIGRGCVTACSLHVGL